MLVSFGSQEIGIIAGKETETLIFKKISQKPDLHYMGLAATTLGLTDNALKTPNVCFHLLRQLAPLHISLAEIELRISGLFLSGTLSRLSVPE